MVSSNLPRNPQNKVKQGKNQKAVLQFRTLSLQLIKGINLFVFMLSARIIR